MRRYNESRGRYLILLLLIACTCITIQAKKSDLKAQTVEKIKTSGEYYWGEGSAASIEQAKGNALVDLSRNIKVVLSNTIRSIEDNYSSTISDKTGISSFASLSNTDCIELSPEPNASVFLYMRKSELQKSIADREKKIIDMTSLGQSLERRGEIASCLKYYSWALALSKVHPHPVKIDINGKDTSAKEWLSAHIGVVLNNIKVDIASVEDLGEDKINRYLVTLDLTYNGEPVADLDFSYHNGIKLIRDNRAKNGQASIEFPELPDGTMDLIWSYRYEKEGASHDDELRSIFESFPAEQFAQAQAKVPVKGNSAKKFKVQPPQTDIRNNPGVTTDGASTAPLDQKHRKQIEQETVAQDLFALVTDRIQSIEAALVDKEPTRVKQLFTPEGWNLLMQMLGSPRDYKVVKAKNGRREYLIRQSGRFLDGRGVPIALKYAGGHQENENIVFRFTCDGLCESVAYAISQRAEEDIFRQNKWDMDARFAILKFMEDYQTAFALKRTDYIRSIFSDDAIIITGKKKKGSSASGANGGSKDGRFVDLSSGYTFTRQSKDEYLKNLIQDFANKNYIKLTFEDNEIIQQASNLAIAQNIYWIEIKQFYSSSSYNDVGYLSLQIDMTAEDPKIKVRTWQPNKIEISELMRRFGYE